MGEPAGARPGPVDEVARLVAERACERLSFDFARLADEGRHSLLAGLFTVDAEFAIPGLHLQGRDAIHAFFVGREALTDLRTRHVCSNVVVDLLSTTEAAGHLGITLYRRRGAADRSVPVPETRPAVVGTYRDRYARVDGRWLIASRVQEVAFADPEDANPLTLQTS